jgi:hypothetical protein
VQARRSSLLVFPRTAAPWCFQLSSATSPLSVVFFAVRSPFARFPCRRYPGFRSYGFPDSAPPPAVFGFHFFRVLGFAPPWLFCLFPNRAAVAVFLLRAREFGSRVFTRRRAAPRQSFCAAVRRSESRLFPLARRRVPISVSIRLAAPGLRSRSCVPLILPARCVRLI